MLSLQLKKYTGAILQVLCRKFVNRYCVRSSNALALDMRA